MSTARSSEASAYEGASYVDLLSLISETNRPPGGKRSVANIARRLFIGPETRVLEIGSNTGFTSIELVKLTGCRATGIDVNEAAVETANAWRNKLPHSISSRLEFRVGNASDTPFDDGSFDVIVCGGANTFVLEKEAALREYCRLLRPYGFLSITNLFYETPPPVDLLVDLEGILGFRPPAWDADRWTKLFAEGWEIYERSTRALVARTDEVLDAYAASLTTAQRLPQLDEHELRAVQNRWREIMTVFNRNHEFLSYLELTLRKQQDGLEEQPELFIAAGEYDPFFELAVVSAAGDQ